MTYSTGDRVRWRSTSDNGTVYYGTVKHVTPKGLYRILFDERENCPKDGRPILERTLAAVWIEKDGRANEI